MHRHRGRLLQPRRWRSRRQWQKSRKSRRRKMDGGISCPGSIICCRFTRIGTELDKVLTFPCLSLSFLQEVEASKRGHREGSRLRIHTRDPRALTPHRIALACPSGSSRHGLDRQRLGPGQLPTRKRATETTDFSMTPMQRRLWDWSQIIPLLRGAGRQVHKMVPSDERSPRMRLLSDPTSR